LCLGLTARIRAVFSAAMRGQDHRSPRHPCPRLGSRRSHRVACVAGRGSRRRFPFAISASALPGSMRLSSGKHARMTIRHSRRAARHRARQRVTPWEQRPENRCSQSSMAWSGLPPTSILALRLTPSDSCKEDHDRNHEDCRHLVNNLVMPSMGYHRAPARPLGLCRWM
jgi:hypothetical protein